LPGWLLGYGGHFGGVTYEGRQKKGWDPTKNGGKADPASDTLRCRIRLNCLDESRIGDAAAVAGYYKKKEPPYEY